VKIKPASAGPIWVFGSSPQIGNHHALTSDSLGCHAQLASDSLGSRHTDPSLSEPIRGHPSLSEPELFSKSGTRPVTYGSLRSPTDTHGHINCTVSVISHPRSTVRLRPSSPSSLPSSEFRFRAELQITPVQSPLQLQIAPDSNPWIRSYLQPSAVICTYLQ